MLGKPPRGETHWSRRAVASSKSKPCTNARSYVRTWPTVSATGWRLSWWPARSATVAERDFQTKRMGKLNAQRRKLLDAFYAGAVDVMMLRE